MNIRNITPKLRTVRGGAPVAAGTGDTQTFTEFDTRGFEGVRCIVVLGALTATATANLQAKFSDTAATYGAGTIDVAQDNSGAAAATATVQATTGDGSKVLTLEFFKPTRRYVRFQLVRATANVVIDSIVIEGINPRNSIKTQATADGYAAIVSNPTFSAV